jgi:hypothetical protein
MKSDDMKMLAALVGIVTVSVLAIVIMVMQPYWEARAFNKFTEGPKATYWDAVWTSLRVTAR